MREYSRAWQLLGLGWYIAICLVAGILGGHWVDQQLGVSPLFLLLGLALGLGAAFWGMYKMLMDVVRPPNN